MSSEFAILTPVGRDTEEVFRLRLLLKSIIKHEPSVRWIVLVDDDELHDRHLDRLLPKAQGCNVVVLKNPRKGLGNGFLGGLAVGVMYGLSWIYENTSAAFAVKLDSDALVIAPFASDVAEVFDNDGQIGQIGVIGRTCNRSDRSYGYELGVKSPLIEMLDRCLANAEQQGGVASPGAADNDSRQRFSRVQHHVTRARSYGYSWLSYCQGGGYAVSRELLRRLRDNKCFVDYEAWTGMAVGEDVVVSMYVHSVGMRLCDRSMDHQPFGVHWRGLPFHPETLIAKRFAIIHSLKNNPAYKENAVYSYFV